MMEYENERVETIKLHVHEKEMTRLEIANRRWFILCIILLVMLFVTNGGWLYYESQFQDVTITQEATSEDGNNYINGTGEMTFNGEGETDDPDPR